jgi:hypothetical protein
VTIEAWRSPPAALNSKKRTSAMISAGRAFRPLAKSSNSRRVRWELFDEVAGVPRFNYSRVAGEYSLGEEGDNHSPSVASPPFGGREPPDDPEALSPHVLGLDPRPRSGARPVAGAHPLGHDALEAKFPGGHKERLSLPDISGRDVAPRGHLPRRARSYCAGSA